MVEHYTKYLRFVWPVRANIDSVVQQRLSQIAGRFSKKIINSTNKLAYKGILMALYPGETVNPNFFTTPKPRFKKHILVYN